MPSAGTRSGVASRSAIGSNAACSASKVSALRRACRTRSVGLRSVRSCSHLSRSAGACCNSASKSIVAGAPCFLAALMAMERPCAVSKRKPIMV